MVHEVVLLFWWVTVLYGCLSGYDFAILHVYIAATYNDVYLNLLQIDVHHMRTRSPFLLGVQRSHIHVGDEAMCIVDMYLIPHVFT